MSWLDELRARLGSMQQPLYEGTMSGLGTVADVASTPAAVTRGVGTTLGELLRGGDAQSAARRTFAGVVDPSQRISGGEVLQNAGIRNPSGVASFAADFASDPLAVGGAIGLGKAGIQAGRQGLGALNRMLAPEAAEAAPAARTLSSPGLTSYTTSPAGEVAATRPAGANVPNFRSPSRFSASSDASISPEGVIFRQPTSEAVMPAGPQSLRDLANQTTHIRGAGFDFEGNPTFQRAFGGHATPNEIDAAIHEILSDYRVHGLYNPELGLGTATTRQGASPLTARHESTHAIADMARLAGDSSSLGLPLRATNAMQYSSSPLARGLGFMGEEAIAHGRGTGRGLLNELRGGWNFLDTPLPVYGEQINSISPMAAAIYNNRVIPNAVRAGAALGVGGGTYAGGNALFNALGDK